jgi:fucose permease
LSGLLTACLGAILPAWRYHIEPDFLLIGNYFLCQNAGVLAGAAAAIALLKKKGLTWGQVWGCALAFAGFMILAGFSPPMPAYWRMLGLFLVGFGAGMINTTAFHAISPAYELDKAATLNLSGVFFGLGCLLCALFLAGAFFIYTVPSILILMAVVPGFASALFARAQMPSGPVVQQPSWRDVFRDFLSPAAILFALLLFFQFGNEGALAGWLALFLTQRLGASPATSLFLLALYWAALLFGRIAAQWLLPRVRHGRLLFGAVGFPMFACVVLLQTNNLFGATVGVLLAGGGFSVILPLVMEKIGDRFPYYHPGFFNGVFSIALAGGLLAPASLGYAANYLGIGVVMGLPLAGSIFVVVLLLLILLESRLSAA